MNNSGNDFGVGEAFNQAHPLSPVLSEDREQHARRQPRIEDVARRADVSIATVSYVLNGRGRVSAPTRARVKAAIRELGYVPSAQGRSLAMRRSYTIGLFTQRQQQIGAGFAVLISGLADKVRKSGYHLLVLTGRLDGHGDTDGDRASSSAFATRADDDQESADPGLLHELIGSGRVDGLVLAFLGADERLPVVEEIALPLVIFGSSASDIPAVDVDHRAAARLAAQHLYDLGHRRIGMIGSPAVWPAARTSGVRDAIGSREPIATVEASEISAKGGLDAARVLLTNPRRPSAIMADDDALAEGVLQCAAIMGIGVPEQLSVVGYGNSAHSAQTFPPLTTVSPEWEALGGALGEAIVERISGRSHQATLVPPNLIVRESTAPVGTFATPATLAGEPVIKSGATYALWSRSMSMDPGAGHHGVYVSDTRMLSLYQARIDGRLIEPQTLRSAQSCLIATYMVQFSGTTRRVRREVTLREDRLEDIWEWDQWGKATPWTLELSAAADFHDVFEVRGFEAAGHGAIDVTTGPRSVRHVYSGRDRVTRTVEITCDRQPDREPYLTWQWTLPPEPSSGMLSLTVAWSNPAGPTTRSRPSTKSATSDGWPQFETPDPTWNATVARSQADIDLLATDWGHGLVPMAGLPWFGALFGRDAIITAFEVIAWRPELAKATVATLASFQGTTDNDDNEEAPGKIVHEIRHGELSRLGEVPFARYYGSVDSTPLFVSLVAATWRRTGDTTWLESVLPAAEAALRWVRAQIATNGLFEVAQRSISGLVIQSWKDSSDSMVFANGEHGIPPLAISEVQGYVYQALVSMAACLRAVGRPGEASTLDSEAKSIQAAFHERFWMEESRYYALAVDSLGRQLDTLSSDAGQCLWSGIVPEDFRSAVVDKLMSPELFSGWGIRTLGNLPGGGGQASSSAYDPYSYHRGSIWPHDTALAAAGLRAAGAAQAASDVAGALIDASAMFPDYRLPELFAGEDRSKGGPFPYPGACAPQAWAAGAPLMLLQTLLGLRVEHDERTVFVAPRLPPSLPWFEVHGLAVGSSSVDLSWRDGQANCQGLPAGWQLRTEPPP